MRFDPCQPSEVGGRRQPARVKLVQCAQLLRGEPLVFGSQRGKGSFEPVHEPGGLVVAAHGIEHVGHE